MLEARTPLLFDTLDRFELRLCLLLNRSCHRKTLRSFFSLISRLGNGIFWYSLMLVLPIAAGWPGLLTAAHMMVVGILGLIIYKLLKSRLLRERPFFTHPDILLGTAPLDKFSFPSGHTLHAVAFSLVVVFHFPALSWLVFPFAALTAMSRIVLGLHYPTDVIVGGMIGATIALLSFNILSI